MHSPRNNLNSRYISSQFNWPPDRCSCHKKLVWVQVFDKPIQFNDWVSRPTHIFLRRLCLFTYAERSQSLRWANVLDEFSEIFNLLATLDFQASTNPINGWRLEIKSSWQRLFICTSMPSLRVLLKGWCVIYLWDCILGKLSYFQDQNTRSWVAKILKLRYYCELWNRSHLK